MLKLMALLLASVFVLHNGAIEHRPPLFYKRIRFAPTARDSALWKMDEECVGKKASMKNVKFYYLPTKKTAVYDAQNHEYIRAYVYWPDSSINLLQRFRSDSQIERHEMIHIIASMTEHDHQTFEVKCNIPILDYRQFL